MLGSKQTELKLRNRRFRSLIVPLTFYLFCFNRLSLPRGFYFCAQADTDRLQQSNLTRHTNLPVSFFSSDLSLCLTQRQTGMSHVSSSTQEISGWSSQITAPNCPAISSAWMKLPQDKMFQDSAAILSFCMWRNKRPGKNWYL